MNRCPASARCTSSTAAGGLRQAQRLALVHGQQRVDGLRRQAAGELAKVAAGRRGAVPAGLDGSVRRSRLPRGRAAPASAGGRRSCGGRAGTGRRASRSPAAPSRPLRAAGLRRASRPGSPRSRRARGQQGEAFQVRGHREEVERPQRARAGSRLRRRPGCHGRASPRRTRRTRSPAARPLPAAA